MLNILNVAQIGVGYWGPNLLRNLVSNERCNVKVVVDLSKERREYVQSMYPAIHVTDMAEEALNDSKIDAIVIATPASTHYDFATKALESDKHILVEKPLAMTTKEVEKIELLANRKNLVVMVGHTFLYNVAVRFIKKVIDEGVLGDVRYIYSQRVNLGRIRTDVDVFWNLAPHDISIIQYLLDEPKPLKVDLNGMAYVQDAINDVAFINIVYPNRILANIHVSWLDPHKIRCMTLVGTKKMIVYNDLSENKVSIFDKGIDRLAILGEQMDFDEVKAFTFNYRTGDIIIPKINWNEPLKTEIEHFVDCVLDGIYCLTGTDHAKNVIRILEMGTK
jgi:predicted dehydrogenase